MLILVAMVGAIVLARKETRNVMLPEPTLNSYLLLSAVLFSIGTAGVFLRRNLITILLSIEVMLNAVNLTFVAVDRYLGSVDGQIIVFFVMTVAAAEAAVGLAIIIALFRHKETLNPDAFTSLEVVTACSSLIPLLPFVGFLINATARAPPAQERVGLHRDRRDGRSSFGVVGGRPSGACSALEPVGGVRAIEQTRLHLDRVGPAEHPARVPARSAGGRDDPGRHRHRHAHPSLLDRLHARGVGRASTRGTSRT